MAGGFQNRNQFEPVVAAAGDGLAEKVEQSLAERRERLTADQATVDKVKQRLASGHKQSAYELKTLIGRLTEAYHQTARSMIRDFSDGLAFRRLFERSVRATFGRKASIKKWIEKLEARFVADLGRRTETLTEEGAAHFVEGLQVLLQQLLRELEDIQPAAIAGDHIFRRIDQRRNDVIDAVKANMAELVGGESFSNRDLQATDSLGPSLVGGSALTAVGAFFLVVTHGLFFDITGGILTGTGLLLAGGVMFVRRNKLIAQLEANLDEGGNQFAAELNERLSTRLNLIFDDIDRNFLALYEYVAQEAARLEPVFDQLQDLKRRQQLLLEDTHGQLQD